VGPARPVYQSLRPAPRHPIAPRTGALAAFGMLAAGVTPSGRHRRPASRPPSCSLSPTALHRRRLAVCAPHAPFRAADIALRYGTVQAPVLAGRRGPSSGDACLKVVPAGWPRARWCTLMCWRRPPNAPREAPAVDQLPAALGRSARRVAGLSPPQRLPRTQIGGPIACSTSSAASCSAIPAKCPRNGLPAGASCRATAAAI